MALASNGQSCADDSRTRWTFRESYYDETITGRSAENKVALLGQ
jgi:hypothetical protein